MTPERAAYHRLMLLAGLREEYEQELDRALETEDPITQPVLDLAFCMSDLNQTISVLYNYTLNFTIDQHMVYDMVLSTLRRLHDAQLLTRDQVCTAIRSIMEYTDFVEPWCELFPYMYDYELWKDGIISTEAFEAAFDAALWQGQRLNVWALENQRRQKKRKSFRDFLRRAT